MNPQKNAFTLVELIVVITILAILWTIAFISLQWYSKDARDSIRISDISSIKTSLELFHLNSGKYPLPDDKQIVDYSTETLWYQWNFWTTVISSLSRSMSEVPTDPLTAKKYIFSVANNKNEFEILSLLEWDWIALNPLIPLSGEIATAASLVVTPKIDWTYNRVFIKTASYIVPVPSIVTSEILSWTMTLDSTNITSQVVNGWENIPEQWNVISNTGALTWLVLSVYTWSIAIDDSNSEKELVIGKIKDAYTWSVLASSDIYEYILATSWEKEIVKILNTIVLKDDTTEVTLVTNTCNESTKPIDNGYIIYSEIPTSPNQIYVQDSLECWYACTWWYTWVNCDTPNPYTNCTWVNAPVIWNASILWVTTYWAWTWNECNTADIIVCTWLNTWITISACNVWTTTAATTVNDTNWYGDYFQFGRNSPYPTWINWDDIRLRDWETTGWVDWTDDWSANYWGVINSESQTTTYSNPQSSNVISMQWPCETDYHIPTNKEWVDIYTAWWWWFGWTNMANDLLLPMAWVRLWNDASLLWQDSYGLYWSASPSADKAYMMYFYNIHIDASYEYERAHGNRIRCFKN